MSTITRDKEEAICLNAVSYTHLLTEKNDILIPNGTRIKPDYVPLIESLGIESVMVEDPYENYESPNSCLLYTSLFSRLNPDNTSVEQ